MCVQDIWSLGITFCEMATAKKPYKNAAAAIFSVCVSKQYPSLPKDMSEEAVAFLGRQVLHTCYLLWYLSIRRKKSQLRVNSISCCSVVLYVLCCTRSGDGRCLVDDATARADCSELLQHPFCTGEVSSNTGGGLAMLKLSYDYEYSSPFS
jgi:serine/threonine protein kinase